jgi:hypothetical protein
MTTPAFSRTYAFDAAPGMEKRAAAQAAVTTTGYIGTQLDQGAAAITDMVLVLNVEAVDVASADEVYTFRVIGSNVANRSDGRILAVMQIGAIAGIAPETVAAAVGDQLQTLFRTERNRTPFRYVDLHLTVAGTTPSINFNAYFSRQH